MFSKRILTFFLSLVLCISSLACFTACGNSDSPESFIAQVIMEDIIETAKDPGSISVANPTITKDGCIAKIEYGGKNSYGAMVYDELYIVVENYYNEEGTLLLYKGYWCFEDSTAETAKYVKLKYLLAGPAFNNIGYEDLDAKKINSILDDWKEENGYRN